MTNIKSFCLGHSWPDWRPLHDIVQSNRGEGELQKVAVFARKDSTCLVYFPDNSVAGIHLEDYFAGHEEIMARWYNPTRDIYVEEEKMDE